MLVKTVVLFTSIAIVALFALVFLSRAGELFRLSVRDGRVLVVSGRVPTSFLDDVRDILDSPLAGGKRVHRATIVGHKSGRGGRLALSGDLADATAQRLRNTFSLYPSVRLVNAPAIARPTLGQRLGIAWLAWLLEEAPK